MTDTGHDALLRYAACGDWPGSLGWCLLTGDEVGALRHAKRSLAAHDRRSPHHLLAFLSSKIERDFAPTMQGDAATVRAWMGHAGYRGASSACKAVIKRICPPRFVDDLMAMADPPPTSINRHRPAVPNSLLMMPL